MRKKTAPHHRDDLDDRIDAWHRSDSKQPLHEFLGMTEAQYAAWVVNGTPPPEKT
jgi:hypothetical protein